MPEEIIRPADDQNFWQSLVEAYRLSKVPRVEAGLETELPTAPVREWAQRQGWLGRRAADLIPQTRGDALVQGAQTLMPGARAEGELAGPVAAGIKGVGGIMRSAGKKVKPTSAEQAVMDVADAMHPSTWGAGGAQGTPAQYGLAALSGLGKYAANESGLSLSGQLEGLKQDMKKKSDSLFNYIDQRVLGNAPPQQLP